MIRRVIFTGLALLVAALVAVRVEAQTGTASISGTVIDASGAGVPGVSIKVVNENTKTETNTVTGTLGGFSVTGLAPGTYTIEASLTGFEKALREVLLGTGQAGAIELRLVQARFTQDVVVTARRVEEVAQEVPIPLSVVSGNLLADTGAFNVNRLKEIIPTVQFYSSNPRNSSIQIRGLGAPYGLTNDGLDSGVGLYIDGVYFARPAAATLDFIDVERVEVLRGPQGTLFGKNTSAGAINVTTKKPSFTAGNDFELNYGNLGFIQAKASLTGPLTKKIAARVSFSGTQRDGTTLNVRTGDDVNDMSNFGFRGQVLFAVTDKLAITAAGDDTRQRAEGTTQVIAGVAPIPLRTANRLFPAIAADLKYTPPSLNPYDRVTDVDTAMRSYQDLGGASVNVDWAIGKGRLTSTTGWRYWDWKPSNDRDFTGLPVTTISSGTSKQSQQTQEVRYAADLSEKLNFVAGVFYFRQQIDSNPVIKQEQGSAAWRWLLAPTSAAATPGLLDGYGFDQVIKLVNVSSAVFGQAQWTINKRLRLLPGLRFNYDRKEGAFDQQVYGGLQTTDPALIALQRSVLAPLTYGGDVKDNNVSGQFTAAFKVGDSINTYATYATGFKSVGFNLNGIPVDAAGQPIQAAAAVRPEDVRHFEAGVKTTPFRGVTFNVTAFNTAIHDFQATVFNGNIGVARGYIANAEKARVRGVEFDGNAALTDHLSLYGAAAYNDGVYVSFKDAPPPFEETGGPTSVDISGQPLPGVSKWAGSLGLEWINRGSFLGRSGEFFTAIDTSARTEFSSSATPSKYLWINGYGLLNARVGFRFSDGWTLSVWSRNLLNKDYLELASAVSGNTGLYVAQPGDQRTIGVTLRLNFKSTR